MSINNSSNIVDEVEDSNGNGVEMNNQGKFIFLGF